MVARQRLAGLVGERHIVRVLDRHRAVILRRLVARLVAHDVVQRDAPRARPRDRHPHLTGRPDAHRPAVGVGRGGHQHAQVAAGERVARCRQVVGVEFVRTHGHAVQRLAVGRNVPVDRVAAGPLHEVLVARRRVPVDGLLQLVELVRLRVVPGDLAAEQRVVRAAEVIHDDEAVDVLRVDQLAVLARLQIENEEDRAFAGTGAAVGTGRDVRDPARLVGRDAVDAVVLHRDVVHLRFAGLRVVHHRVAAGVVLALLLRVRVTLLRAEVDLPARAHVVPRVNLGLRAEALQVFADDLVAIDDGLHLLRLRVEFDEPRVDAVRVRADIHLPVVALDDGEVALAVRGGVERHRVRRRRHPLRFLLRVHHHRREQPARPEFVKLLARGEDRDGVRAGLRDARDVERERLAVAGHVVRGLTVRALVLHQLPVDEHLRTAVETAEPEERAPAVRHAGERHLGAIPHRLEVVVQAERTPGFVAHVGRLPRPVAEVRLRPPRGFALAIGVGVVAERAHRRVGEDVEVLRDLPRVVVGLLVELAEVRTADRVRRPTHAAEAVLILVPLAERDDVLPPLRGLLRDGGETAVGLVAAELDEQLEQLERVVRERHPLLFGRRLGRGDAGVQEPARFGHAFGRPAAQVAEPAAGVFGRVHPHVVDEPPVRGHLPRGGPVELRVDVRVHVLRLQARIEREPVAHVQGVHIRLERRERLRLPEPAVVLERERHVRGPLREERLRRDRLGEVVRVVVHRRVPGPLAPAFDEVAQGAVARHAGVGHRVAAAVRDGRDLRHHVRVNLLPHRGPRVLRVREHPEQHVRVRRAHLRRDAVGQHHEPVGDRDLLVRGIEVARVERLVLLRFVPVVAVVGRERVGRLRVLRVQREQLVAERIGQRRAAPLEPVRVRLPADLRAPVRVRVAVPLRDVHLQRVPGGEEQPAHAVAALVVLVRVPHAAVDRARRGGEVHVLQRDRLEIGNHLAHLARHEPAAAEAVEEFVHRVAGREVGLAHEPDALRGDDVAEALLVGGRLRGRAERGDRGRADQHANPRVVRLRRGGDHVHLRPAHLAEVEREVFHRFAEALPLALGFRVRERRRGRRLVGGHRRGVGDDDAPRLPVRDECDIGAGLKGTREYRDEGGEGKADHAKAPRAAGSLAGG